MDNNIKIVGNEDKPNNWPANAKEYILENAIYAAEDFEKNPSYVTKERLISLVSDYDLNQRSFLGLYRVTDYEVSLINTLYICGLRNNINALKVYTYEIVAESTRLQKNMAYMSDVIQEKTGISIREYEEGLILPLKFMYFAYQKFTVEKNKYFADQIIEIVEQTLLDNNTSDEMVYSITQAYINMMNDIGYMPGNKKFAIWQFTREELYRLFSLEIELIHLTKQSPIKRPLKGVLMTQISNFILKSRHDYNDDYICKYISQDVAASSVINHEIWMNKTENLNDKREQRVIPELFEDTSWNEFLWARDIDFSATRTYYVSSFSKAYDNKSMGEYGECVYGFKGDRLVDLLAPIQMAELERNKDADSSIPHKIKVPRLAQVLAFDVLYSREEAKDELRYLMGIIDKFEVNEKEKKQFLQEILQYWILSVKDKEWKHEKERRYVLFIYPEYNYKEMEIDDGFLKLKTKVFLTPDFILGDNPVKAKIKAYIENKTNAISMKDYVYCKACFSRDYDAVIKNGRKSCSICGSTDVELVHI